jgi:hypothetical protein
MHVVRPLALLLGVSCAIGVEHESPYGDVRGLRGDTLRQLRAQIEADGTHALNPGASLLDGDVPLRPAKGILGQGEEYPMPRPLAYAADKAPATNRAGPVAYGNDAPWPPFMVQRSYV